MRGKAMPDYWQPPEGGVGGPEPLVPQGPPPPRNDQELSEGVRDAFLLDLDLSKLPIDVQTENGVVELLGAVPSEELRQRARDLAQGVEGVKEVLDHLRIRQQGSGPVTG
jgi:hypothetical protein